jgi:hypothetical protein
MSPTTEHCSRLDVGKAPPACDLCKDYGIVARRVNTGTYVCAGPVPEDARRVYEDFCECEEGQRMRSEDRRVWAKVFS